MQAQRELERYRNDALYFEGRRQELLRQHPERWIAVYEQQVVGTATRLPQLIKLLEKRGLPRRRVFIEHLSAKEDLLILLSR